MVLEGEVALFIGHLTSIVQLTVAHMRIDVLIPIVLGVRLRNVTEFGIDLYAWFQSELLFSSLVWVLKFSASHYGFCWS